MDEQSTFIASNQNTPSSLVTDFKTPNPPQWLTITAITTVVVMVTVGVPGNLLIVLVYWKRNAEHIASGVFIMSLATVDCLTCALVVPSLPFIMADTGHPSYHAFWWSLSVVVAMLSVWLLVAIAHDHYRAICTPLSPHSSARTAALVVGVGCAWSVLMGALLGVMNIEGAVDALGFDLFRVLSGLYLVTGLLLLALLYVKMFCFLSQRNKVGVGIHLPHAPSGRSRGGTDRAAVTVSVITAPTSSDHTSAVLGPEDTVTHGQSSLEPMTSPPRNDTTRHVASKSEVWREGDRVVMGPTQCRVRKGVRKTAKMLAVVSILFVLSYTPTYVLPAVVDDLNFAYVFTHFINHAANPFIYSFMNPRFRRNVKRLLARRR